MMQATTCSNGESYPRPASPKYAALGVPLRPFAVCRARWEPPTVSSVAFFRAPPGCVQGRCQKPAENCRGAEGPARMTWFYPRWPSGPINRSHCVENCQFSPRHRLNVERLWPGQRGHAECQVCNVGRSLGECRWLHQIIWESDQCSVQTTVRHRYDRMPFDYRRDIRQNRVRVRVRHKAGSQRTAIPSSPASPGESVGMMSDAKPWAKSRSQFVDKPGPRLQQGWVVRQNCVFSGPVGPVTAMPTLSTSPAEFDLSMRANLAITVMSPNSFSKTR